MKATHWIQLLALSAAVVTAAAFALHRKLRREQDVSVPEEVLPEKPDTETVITEGIGKNAARFSGLYEGIYTAVSSQSLDRLDAYKEWHIRMQNFREDEAFYQAFTEQFPQEDVQLQHLELLMACIRAAGITRGSETAHIADKTTAERYIYFGSGSPCPGTEYPVFKPCWTMGEKIIEQGVLMPKE